MFLSREMDLKLCQIYMKIYAILYKSCRFKQLIFSKYKTNLKKTISYKNLRISGLLLLYFHFSFFIDIIDNIITFNPYSRVTSPWVLQPMTVQHAGHAISVCTMCERYCPVIGWSYCYVIRTIRIKCNNFIEYIYEKWKMKI